MLSVTKGEHICSKNPGVQLSSFLLGESKSVLVFNWEALGHQIVNTNLEAALPLPHGDSSNAVCGHEMSGRDTPELLRAPRRPSRATCTSLPAAQKSRHIFA